MTIRVYVAVLLASCMAASTAIEPLKLIGQMNVHQLEDIIRDVMEEVLASLVIPMLPVGTSNDDTTDGGVALHPNCTDSNIYNGCPLVVQYHLCSTAQHYARYCCRSCTLKNQIPIYGPHLANTAEAPVEANLTTDDVKVQLGSEVRLSCHTSGYPSPDVAWFKGSRLLGNSEKYTLSVIAALNPLVQRPKSDLIIQDFQPEDADTYTCLAVNQAGTNTSSIYLSVEAPIQANIIEGRQLYGAGSDVRMVCRAKGYNTPKITWFKDFIPIMVSNKFTRVENGSVNRLLTTVEDTLTIKNANESDSGMYMCNATNAAGFQSSTLKLMVKDVQVHSNCTDVIDSSDCLQFLSNECTVTDYIARFCCRTCTLIEAIPRQGPHLLNIAKAPLSADLRLSTGNSLWKFPWGSDVSISCTSGSLLKPNVLWYKDGLLLEESDKYQIQVSTEKVWVRHFVKSQLTVKQLRVHDTGRYTCRAMIPSTTEERHATLIFEQDGLLSFRERIK